MRGAHRDRARGALQASGAVLAVCLALLGCVTAVPLPAPRSERTDPPVATDPGVVSMLLLLEDRRLYEPVTVDRSLVEGPAVRARLADALGRVGGAEAELVLDELLIDPEVEVRRAAAHASAVLSSPALGAFHPLPDVPASGDLVSAIGADDLATARSAVQALALRGVELDDVSEALVELRGEEEEGFWSRLVPALPFFEASARQAAARVFLESEAAPSDPMLRRQALRALLLDPDEIDVERHRDLCLAGDPWIRAWACRALGDSGDRQDLARLAEVSRSALEIEDLLARSALLVAATQGAARLVRRAVVAPSEEWRDLLLPQLSSPLAGPRLAAQRAADAWLLDPSLGGVLENQADAGDGEALLALVRGRQPGVAERVAAAVGSPDVGLATAAARGAALLGIERSLESALLDSRAVVRWAALGGVAEVRPEGAAEALRLALADSSASVRTAALAWLAERPLLTLEEIAAGLAELPADALELRLQAVRAIAAVAHERSLERGAAVVALEEHAESELYPVRTAAAVALARLGRPAPALGGPSVRRGVDYYEAVLSQARGDRFLRMTTTQGELDFRLACEEAPQSCVSFVQLAEQGFYDGLELDRLVPGERIAGGDPFGDGYGGPGYRLRDEPTRIALDRPGRLVLERSGPEAAGSRFFLTLAPLPDLDLHEVVLGEAVTGLDALARLAAGDHIVTLREIPAPPRWRRESGENAAQNGEQSPVSWAFARFAP